MTAPVQVELLTVPDCPGGVPTEQLLHELALQLQIELQLQRTVINTQQQADQAHFPGSPTVRIAGIDPVDTDAPASLACRLYRAEAGMRPIPARATLHAALRTAAEATSTS